MRKVVFVLLGLIVGLAATQASTAAAQDTADGATEGCVTCLDSWETYGGQENVLVHMMLSSGGGQGFYCTGPGPAHQTCHWGSWAPGMCVNMHNSGCGANLALEALKQEKESGGDVITVAYRLAREKPRNVAIDRATKVLTLKDCAGVVIAHMSLSDLSLVINEDRRAPSKNRVALGAI